MKWIRYQAALLVWDVAMMAVGMFALSFMTGDKVLVMLFGILSLGSIVGSTVERCFHRGPGSEAGDG